LRVNVTDWLPIKTMIEALPFFNAFNCPAASTDTTFLFVLWKMITPWASAGCAATLSFSLSPAFIVLPGGGFCMLIDVASLPPTDTAIRVNTPLSAVTVIMAEPVFIALTLPFWVTETILGLLDTQVSCALALLPVTGTTPSVAEEPFFRYTVDCATAKLITFAVGVLVGVGVGFGGTGVGVEGTGVGVEVEVTITVHVAVMPLEVVTIITAVPGLIAVTNPSEETPATYALLEFQLNVLS